MLEVGRGYSNLEYDLAEGKRGSRQDHIASILTRLTGAEAALVVNNNAAAVLLALAALADGRDVLVSRGELIEIGDGFRIPDVLTRSGARLVEVGTTNRTRIADYEAALSDETAAILRVHQSNFRLVGFTEQPDLAELAQLARRHELPLVDDLGSGALIDLGDEPTARASLAAGADLVSLLGRQAARRPAGRDPRRAEQTSSNGSGAIHSSVPSAPTSSRSPRSRQRSRSTSSRSARAARSRSCACSRSRSRPSATARSGLPQLVGGEVEETVARVGGGALPLLELPSFACAIEEELGPRLRAGQPPVVGIVRDGRLLLDCRTVSDAEVEELAAAVASARTS